MKRKKKRKKEEKNFERIKELKFKEREKLLYKKD